MHELAETFRTRTLEDLLMKFGSQARIFSLTAAADEAIPDALIRLREEAVTAVRAGCALLVLDDSEVYSGERLWLDPLLAVSAIDQALREAPDERNLRRRVGIVVRSGALRDLHDLVLCVALGATAVQPYQMYAVALGLSPRRPKILPDAAEKQDMMRPDAEGAARRDGKGHFHHRLPRAARLWTFFQLNWIDGCSGGLFWHAELLRI